MNQRHHNHPSLLNHVPPPDRPSVPMPPVPMQKWSNGPRAGGCVIQGTFSGGKPCMSIQPAMRPAAPGVVNPASPTVHGAALIQRTGNATTFPLPALPPSGPGQSLDAEVQSKMEAALGADFSDVRIHVSQQAPSIAARAYTQGSNIYFAPGQYNPNPWSPRVSDAN